MPKAAFNPEKSEGGVSLFTIRFMGSLQIKLYEIIEKSIKLNVKMRDSNLVNEESAIDWLVSKYRENLTNWNVFYRKGTLKQQHFFDNTNSKYEVCNNQ